MANQDSNGGLAKVQQQATEGFNSMMAGIPGGENYVSKYDRSQDYTKDQDWRKTYAYNHAIGNDTFDFDGKTFQASGGGNYGHPVRATAAAEEAAAAQPRVSTQGVPAAAGGPAPLETLPFTQRLGMMEPAQLDPTLLARNFPQVPEMLYDPEIAAPTQTMPLQLLNRNMANAQNPVPTQSGPGVQASAPATPGPTRTVITPSGVQPYSGSRRDTPPFWGQWG